MKSSNNKLKNLIVVGDRVLLKPNSPAKKTKSGLLLPPGYNEKEEIQSGYIIKTGPGYPVPVSPEAEESWKNSSEENIRYIPLQCREGDFALFMQKGAIEILYHGEKYYIVPQQSILLLEREED